MFVSEDRVRSLQGYNSHTELSAVKAQKMGQMPRGD